MKRKNIYVHIFAQKKLCSYTHFHVCHLSQENEMHVHNQGFIITQICYFLLLRNASPRLYLMEESGLFTSKCRIFYKTSNKADFNVLLLFFFFLILMKIFLLIYSSSTFIHVFWNRNKVFRGHFQRHRQHSTCHCI